MKHKDGLDIAAVLLLLLAAVAVMVVPVALVRPQLLAVPAILVLIALCVVLYQRRRLRTFLAKQLCSTEFENSRIQYSLANLPIATVLINDGRILWYNQHFKEQVLGDYDAVTRPVERVLPEFDLAVCSRPHGQDLTVGERRFTAYSATAKGSRGASLVYLIDDTFYKETLDEYNASRPACLIIVIDSYDELFDDMKDSEQAKELEAINNPEDPEAGSHLIEFSRELWMEREDFMEDAPKKYFRMTPGQEVRLKNAYIVKCTGCKKDENGIITEVYCEYDANTRSGMPDANRKVKGTLHWVSCNHCMQAEVRLYDRLWKVENPRDELAAIREAKNCDALEAMKDIINPDSLKVLPNCYIEKFAATLPPLSYLQFQRIGYFNIDKESTPDKLIFNRTVVLKDTWGKINK